MKWYWILLIALAVIALGVIIGMNVKKKSVVVAPTLVVKPEIKESTGSDKIASTTNADGSKTISVVK